MSKFDEVVKEAKAAHKREGSLWVLFVEFTTQECAGLKVDELKAVLKAKEDAAKQAKPSVNLQEMGAYRSCKSVIVRAVEAGISLLDGTEVKGKTEVEKELKALKVKETAYETIKRCIALIGDKLPEVTDKTEISLTFGLLDEVHKVSLAKANEALKIAA